jgi:hypothetical protein
MATDTSASYTEYSLSIDSFNRPQIFKDKDAVAIKLIELILLDAGTYPTRPNMGVSLISKYRFTTSDDLDTLKNSISDQISTYLPELTSVSVSVTEADNDINIEITVDVTVYDLVFNKTTKTLSSL